LNPGWLARATFNDAHRANVPINETVGNDFKLKNSLDIDLSRRAISKITKY
jgi:hypothetical protein